MTSEHSSASRSTWRPLAAAAVALALLAPAEAPAAPAGRPRLGWSNAPRWRLPATRPPECPRGFEGRRALVQVRKARCKETGPSEQARTPPRPPAPGLGAAPAPGGRPAASQAPTWAPSGYEDPGPSLGVWPDATALMRMGAGQCHDLLREHDVAFAAVDPRDVPEVAIPVRLRGPVAGVTFTIPWSEDEGRDHHAIWDCRLVAAVVPLAAWLRAHGVVEVQYFSALRRGKIVQQKPRSQHNTGLALDLYALRREGEAAATVEEQFPRRVLRSCPAAGATGPGAPPPRGAPMSDLYLALVCQSVERGLVHTLLTPDHDRAHANHLHFDLKPAQRGPADPYVSFFGL